MAFGPLSGSAGLDLDFISRLERLRQIMPNGLGSQISIRSGYRSPERQAFLFDRAVRKYGSVAAARKWVAPPGRSQHNNRKAADLGYGSPAAMQAAHQYAPQVGLVFPMSYEDWHIEPVGARGGKAAGAVSALVAPASGQGFTADTAGATPESSVAGLLADASGGDAGGGGLPSINSGGGPQSAGLPSELPPAPAYDLQTMSVASAPEDIVAQGNAGPEAGLSQLAGLFTLPTIGQPGGAPPGADTLPGGLPGQAKALGRKVWK